MADDKKVFVLVSAVSTNMDRLRQSIDHLRHLHDRWKDNSGTFINLIAQLTALKSNLSEMQDWMNYAIQDIHPQLLSDLDVLMVSCGTLLRNVDRLIAQLRQPDHDHMDVAIRMKLAVGSRSMKRLRGVAKRQTDAVTLLLAACKCHTTAQRKILLHKSRQIRKADHSSLSTLATRTSKWDGPCINALTQLSRMIQWFRFLFYIKLLRKPGDDAPTEDEYLDAAAVMRSEAIDRQLEEDATWLRRETKLILLGAGNTSGKDLIMRQMKVRYADGYPRNERITYTYQVRRTVRLLIHAIIDLLRDTGIKLSDTLNQDFAILLNEVETVDTGTITPSAVQAVSNIWASTAFSTIFVRNFEIDFPQYASYFANEIERISADDYIPSEADITRLAHPTGHIKELRFTWDNLDVHLFNISSYIPEQFRKRWFHQFENATALIYTVDVSLYDRPYNGHATESQLLLEFATFESCINAPSFIGSSVILLLNNFSRFREKLPHSPLTTFFPDFEPGADAETAARQYILRRFKDLNKNRLSIYSFWVDLDMSDNQHLYAALKKTINHVQTRKARGEVFNASSTGVGVHHSASQSKSTGIYSPVGTVGSGTLSSPNRSEIVTASSRV